MGGTISGEHGIGLEKKEQMSLIFSADDLAAMARLKASFNPRDLFNPDKIFPSRVSCAEVREVRQDSRHAKLLERVRPLTAARPSAPDSGSRATCPRSRDRWQIADGPPLGARR